MRPRRRPPVRAPRRAPAAVLIEAPPPRECRRPWPRKWPAVFLGQREILAVAIHFGVGCLAHHDDADIRARGAGAVPGVRDRVAVDGGLRIAARIVVPPVVSPRLPCQSTVQPPHCMPRSSAPCPVTWMRCAVRESGSTPPSFLSRTSDRAPPRAPLRGGLPSRSSRHERRIRHAAASVGSIRPMASFTRRMRVTASSMRDWHLAFFTSS